MPYRGTTVLVPHPLTTNTDMAVAECAHPVLAATRKLTNYHWDTPAYREACLSMRLPPDECRPTFRPRYRRLAEALMADHGTRPFEQPRYRHIAAVELDLLDLMREDLWPSPLLLDRTRLAWRGMASDAIPFAEEIGELIGSDELLKIDKPPTLRGPASDTPRARIDFLPSRHGGGFTSSISGYWGDCDLDGWVAPAYGDLHGLAVEPDREHLETSTWLRVVYRRLSKQGVLFIARGDVRAYLDNEGSYWFARHNGSDLARWAREVRTPTSTERFYWSFVEPSFSMDRRLRAHEAAIRFEAP